MRSIRSLRKAFPSKSKDSIFAFFLRLTAATHKENKLYWEFFHFIISLLKYLKYWTTNTGKKYVFYDLGEDKRWFHGMLSNSFSRDFGFRCLASIKMSTLYPECCSVQAASKHWRNYLHSLNYVSVDALPKCTKQYFIWQDLQWKKSISNSILFKSSVCYTDEINFITRIQFSQVLDRWPTKGQLRVYTEALLCIAHRGYSSKDLPKLTTAKKCSWHLSSASQKMCRKKITVIWTKMYNLQWNVIVPIHTKWRS